MATQQELRAQLKLQLDFLRRSSQAYDDGFHYEAIRLAMTMRVLLHHKPKSPSLLVQLQAGDIKLLSDAVPDLDSRTFEYIGMGVLRTGDRGFDWYPALEDGGHGDSIPASVWWAQTVMILDSTPLTRETIVKNAANKDGGAHVDLDTKPAPYSLLSAVGSVGHVSGPGQETRPVVDYHFLCLRQMAYELLNSPELIALSELTDQP